MNQAVQSFVNDPFGFVDSLNLTVKGINFNFFQKYHWIQKVLLGSAVLCFALWAFCGFDSSPLQFIHAAYEGIPALLNGGSLADVKAIYWEYYGKEMHYSAFVIYFLLAYFMSKSWEAGGVTKTKNIIFSFAGMIMAISVFEWFWILSFGHFQNQPWVYTWEMPQLRILAQNTVFLFSGLLCCLYMLTERFHWSTEIRDGKRVLIQGERAYYFNARSLVLWITVALSVLTAVMWIYYPWHVDQITVVLENGSIWQSSRLFPQTLYTVSLNPDGAVNAGEWHWVQNDAIHAWNTLVKILWAASFYWLFRVTRAKGELT